MRYYYNNESIKEYFYKSIYLHIAICFLFFANDLINFSGDPLEITNSDRCVPIKIGQISNTRMKEKDIQMQSYKKQEQLKNEIKKQVVETISQQNSESQTTKSPNKPNQLELKNKKKHSNKNIKNKEMTNNNQKIPLKTTNESKNLKTQSNSNNYVMSDISETDGTVTRSNVHEIRFKNDIIEYIKANWNPPDFLLDKDLKVTVLIKFNKKTGLLVHYEIKNYPQTAEYKALVDSVKKLMYIMTVKALPIIGKKISSDSIIFTFNPMYN